ncbi:hypothetical protein GGS23DRAFT_502589 [Durotheca rogersii]|uniref:uncharacterized protein n=1 Tax=Durotheca rogersii TaxID=419775 RepID=UPI002220E8D3|nr:uncharacterized protein GGS23DRAFT_502589 [Durotheca rogersii]KAI5853667.1 hypothetical protein GGS23DRAFT_502589 [Durotheca rogersii]
MGRFPPPHAARTRSRSRAAFSRDPHPETQETVPFDYQYVNAPSNQRHVSDTAIRPSPSHRSPSSQEYRDPFQYQTEGPRAPYTEGTPPGRSSVSGPRRSTRAAVRVSPGPESSDETNEEGYYDEPRRGDDRRKSTHSPSRNRGREAIVVEAASPEPEPEHRRSRSKKPSPPDQPSGKRKSVSSGKKRRGK